MIDWLKTNWKTAFVGLAVAVVVLSLLCCNGSDEPAVIEEVPVEEVTPVEVAPVTE